ncbi:MAG: hypothetical protein K0S58_2883 [Nitrospira sp.]|nr:hypothetical protein [Nitrospira sp.]
MNRYDHRDNALWLDPQSLWKERYSSCGEPLEGGEVRNRLTIEFKDEVAWLKA